jgi:histidine kinase/DNA gyrase B/HSP90-like ATPase
LDNSEKFTVDASLLAELGERLIGRPNIALAELVKNSYDADAATCRIEFGNDQITICDDGTGMSETDFLRYWMRIADRNAAGLSSFGFEDQNFEFRTIDERLLPAIFA